MKKTVDSALKYLATLGWYKNRLDPGIQGEKLMGTGFGMVAALAGLLLSAPALSAAGAKPLVHLYTVAVDVNAQGQVAASNADTDTPAPIAAVLNQALKQWRFVPAMHDGHAASVHSYLMAEVQALPVSADKYRVRVSYVGIGPKYQEPKSSNGPDYLQQVLRALVGHSARVVVDLTLSPDGKLAATDADLTTDGELNTREKLMLKAAIKRFFLQGSIMPELVNGQAVAASVQQSMSVSLIPGSISIGVMDKSSYEATTFDLRPARDRLDQASAASVAAAAEADAAQGHSVLKPSMVDTVILQP
ncbi:MAG TPA: hypothetical protein VGN24_01415 [Rhodanobacter sp.]|nr:hypothetical protein [Rhodanobacter sp.]